MADPKVPTPSDHLRALYHHVANWKRHAEHLYSFSQTQMLEWPALSIDWLPDRKTIEDGRDYSLQYLVAGTQALPGSQNYLSVMEFALPLDRDDAEDFYNYQNDANSEGEGSPEPDPYQFRSVKGHSRLDQVVLMDGQVLKVRAMPQQSDIVAAKTTTGYVSLVNLARRAKVDTGSSAPDLRLKGHRIAGFGLAWHPTRPGIIASGSDDQQVLMWDCEGNTDDLGEDGARSGPSGTVPDVSPSMTLTGHTDNVHDVCWHATQDHILASVSEDRSCRLWDTRSKNTAILIAEAHKGTAYGVSMHPTAAFQFATVGSDRIVKLWDMRRPNGPSHTMVYHSNAITSVSWAPFSDSVLATASADRRVVLWDIAKMDQPAQDDGDVNAPPELSFLHAGHISRVSDLVWNPSLEDEWLLATCDMTNCLQIWKPLNEVVYDYLNADVFDVDTGEA